MRGTKPQEAAPPATTTNIKTEPSDLHSQSSEIIYSAITVSIKLMTSALFFTGLVGDGYKKATLQSSHGLAQITAVQFFFKP